MIAATAAGAIARVLSPGHRRLLSAAVGVVSHADWTRLGSWGEQLDLFNLGLVESPWPSPYVRATDLGLAVAGVWP